LLSWSVCAAAQNLKIAITKATFSYKQDETNFYMIQYKVLSGSPVGGERVALTALQNGQIKGYGSLYVSTSLKTGETTKYEDEISVAGGPIAVGTTLVSHDLVNINLPANRTFSFKTQQAFLGNTNKDFFAPIQNLKGTIQVGDMLEYVNDKGQRGKAKITDIDIEKIHIKTLVEGIAGTAFITVVSDTENDFTNATVTSVGGLKNVPATTTKSTETAAKAAPKGKTKTIPVNAVLENSDVKITVHNLIKFNPDPANSQYDIFKVDYSLDYYIVDCTIENKTNKPVDAGEYMLRFNFFDKNGKSADEFLRVFKSENSKDEVKKDAEKIDVNVFGGTSKIRLSQVMVKYQDFVPDYDTKHKAAANAIMKELAPKQKIRSELATLMGVPPSYKIEGLGTWGGTFFNKKNLLFVPISNL
jgi:hypothetical protein